MFLPHVRDDRPFFLSTLTAGPGQRRLAVAAVALSLIIFGCLAPFAKVQLPVIWAFIPSYEAWLVATDIVTAVLLFNQYLGYRCRGVFLLACGYLFTAGMTIAHALTFPGLFAPGGLLGAGPQSTAWLYMFWHGGFPLFVIAYARSKDPEGALAAKEGRILAPMAFALVAIVGAVSSLTALVTGGQHLLPAIMEGHRYTPTMITVVSTVWLLSAVALFTLWRRRSHSVLDLWLMVSMCAWLIDIALSAVLNQGRYDLGFYAGRIYGLLAASFVLLVLLTESGMLYRKLVQLTEALQRLTTQDALTGIANRRAFDHALGLEWHQARRSGLPLSLMMIDIDHFKAFNDRYGHLEGDRCLRAVARALQAGAVRTTDLVARYGGEEFAVLLPLTDAEAALHLAERLRSAVEDLAIGNEASGNGRVTISVGVASMHAPWPQALSLDDGALRGSAALVEMADQALYAAKAAGRNRVMAYRDAG